MASYITQWRQVHHIGADAATLSLNRRKEAMERWQTVTPMIQSMLDHHSNIDFDSPLESKLTPLLLGSIVQQICSTERQLLLQEVERVISGKLGSRGLDLEASARGRSTISHAQEPPRVASTFSRQSGFTHSDRFTDGDDPNDSDYAEDMFTGHLRAEDRRDESRRQTRSMSRSSPPAAALSTNRSSSEPSSQVEDEHISELEEAGTQGRDFATASPNANTSEEDPESRPETAVHETIGQTTPDTAGSSSSGASIRQSIKTLQISDDTTPSNNPAPRVFIFDPPPAQDVGSLPFRVSASAPPQINWSDGAGQFNFGYQPTDRST